MFVPLACSGKFFNVKKFSRLCLLQKHSWNGSPLLLIHHQKRERRCSAARRCECPTIVCKKWVRKGWNFGQYIIKIGSGGVFLQEGVNVQP